MANVIAVAYLIMCMAVLLACVFGISVSASDRRAASNGDEHAYQRKTGYLIFASLVGSYMWPIFVPVWLAWRGGKIVDANLKKRDKQLEQEMKDWEDD